MNDLLIDPGNFITLTSMHKCVGQAIYWIVRLEEISRDRYLSPFLDVQLFSWSFSDCRIDSVGKICNKIRSRNRLTRRSAKRTFQRTRQKSLLRRLFPGQTVVCRKASLPPTAAQSQCQRSHRRSGYAFRPPPNGIHIATYSYF